VKAGLFN